MRLYAFQVHESMVQKNNAFSGSQQCKFSVLVAQVYNVLKTSNVNN